MDKTGISTSELKARCSEIVSRVERTRTPVDLTRRGRKVARIVPVEGEADADLFGFAKGSIAVHGNIVQPVDVAWEAAE
ncbi:MAG: type II toxin-antitoxin system Phd/YefM family antitoxin [Deltaproteobacteria bacterium]|nr:type II toxin-antitoxin system Phd/YefM family antitoxin [Deltaproteobacteria bacterium]